MAFRCSCAPVLSAHNNNPQSATNTFGAWLSSKLDGVAHTISPLLLESLLHGALAHAEQLGDFVGGIQRPYAGRVRGENGGWVVIHRTSCAWPVPRRLLLLDYTKNPCHAPSTTSPLPEGSRIPPPDATASGATVHAPHSRLFP